MGRRRKTYKSLRRTPHVGYRMPFQAAPGLCFVASGTGVVAGRNGYSEVEIKSGMVDNHSND